MALLKCEEHPPKTTPPRTKYHQPCGDGYALVCGSSSSSPCRKPGLVWLSAAEESKYEAGERVFSVGPDDSHKAGKVRVR